MNLWAALQERLIHPIMRAQGSPTSIARGAALGVWFTLTPTVGIQMFLVTAVGIPWRANLPIAIALVWVSNPLTIIPMYYAYYWLGMLVLGEPTRSYADLAVVFLDLIGGMEDPEWTFLGSLRVLGEEVLWPLLLGSVILATVMAIPAYHLALRLAWRRRARQLREQAARLAVQDPDQAPPQPPSEVPQSPPDRCMSETP